MSISMKYILGRTSADRFRSARPEHPGSANYRKRHPLLVFKHIKLNPQQEQAILYLDAEV